MRSPRTSNATLRKTRGGIPQVAADVSAADWQHRDGIEAHAFAEDVERHLEENTRRHPTGGSRRLGG